MQARSWTGPLAPLMPSPDAFLVRRLQLEDAWLEDDGSWRPIDALTVVELWSILGYLRWHAPLLMRHDPDAAADRPADAWLHSRPLVRAVERELVERRAVAPGAALDALRALGGAPWELPDAYRRPTRRGAAGGRG